MDNIVERIHQVLAKFTSSDKKRKIFTPDVFVSYSWKDSEQVVPFVNELIKYLSAKDITVFFDRDSRPLNDPGALNTGLASGLSTAKIFLPLPGWNYLDSKWCSKELSAFFWRYISETSLAEDNKKNPNVSLAASPHLYCLPVVVGCDDSFEAYHDFEKLELALISVAHKNSIEIDKIREFLSSGNGEYP